MKHPFRETPEADEATPEQRKEAADGATELFFEPPPPKPMSEPPAPLKAPAPEPKAPPHKPAAIMNDPGHTTILGGHRADSVVGWLVVLEGPGRGNYRSVYNGSNTIGRNHNQRVPINFGDDTISGEQQAFLVYDGKKRHFQLVPNLGRPNLVHLNDSALLSGAVLNRHDKITMGRTTLLFVPLCGPDFDWADIK